MTFEELKAQMQAWLSVDTTRLPAATCGLAINMAQYDLRLLDLRCFEATATINTTASQAYSSLPSRWSRPLGMLYVTADATKYINYISKEEFDNRYAYCAPASYGIPDHYTEWGGKLYWGPTPAAVYAITHNYMQTLPDLADGAPNNTNDLVATAWPAVFFGALAYVCTYIIEDARKSIFAAEAALQANKLQVEHTRARCSGRRPESAMPGRKY